MSVDLEPAELSFKRPFTHEVSQTLRLKNTTSDPVAFKVKTTAPKQYCVRPNSGRIEAGRDVEVQVLLQAMKEDPPADARCRDKFLVQSVSVPSDKEFTSVTQVWALMEQTSKGSIQEKKIRVNWLNPEDHSTSSTGYAAGAGTAGVVGGAAAGAGIANGLGQHKEESPPAYSSPSPQAVTPARSTAAPSGAVSTPADKPYNSINRGDAIDSAHNPATDNASTSTFSNAMSTVGLSSTTQAQLQQQLDAANAKIKQLSEQATDGLRQRNIIGGAESGDGKSTTAKMSQSLQNAPAPGGVPVQIVAALCLLCFLIAYLFF
ncbi:phosphatidylinositol-binding protein scs2 [Elasticomyces elasticus]|nr:phosphatidylinositol-binding protein scs2 [Elasticomyces elasticus]KAK3629201.1 phosphatidylinositol-binding protein scs2 [Elasticomyces elasticus]KAK4905718.1 phosphatidylinositol-binding protein scs2 [Elasticomyces elasticus]KAK5745123.1 phosphatidylinositol-binding protein scs2 [Elasticomyces elasticus]KAK5764485.1 phosphatidylinositol-binding protein scs2 [Elasticomyces elasticus]